MANKKLIHNIINKTRKSFDFRYQQAIIRNKNQNPKNPPLVKLLQYLQSIKISDAEIDQVVREYWEAVEKNPSFQKEIADKNAYANLMLDPGTLPVAPKPYKTLITEYNLPRPLEDFDFGPEPIKGATATYTTPWTNLAGDLLSSLANQGGPPTQNLGNFNYSNFVTPQYSNAFSQTFDTSMLSSSFDVGSWTGGLGSYADLGSSLPVKY